MGIPQEKASIQTYERIKAEHMEIVEEQEQKITACMERIQELVHAGESTGDRIEDYAIVHGLKADQALAFYRMLDTGVREHQGELVLVVESNVRPTVLGILPVMDSHNVLEKIILGVLEGELQLPLEQTDLALPMKRRVSTGDRGSHLEVQEGPLPLRMGVSSWYLYRRPIKEPNNELAPRPTRAVQLDILFGGTDIASWFAERGRHDILLFAHLCRKLNEPLPRHDKINRTISDERERILAAIRDNDQKHDDLLRHIESGRRDGSAKLLRTCLQNLRTAIKRAEELQLGDEPEVRRVCIKIEPLPEQKS